MMQKTLAFRDCKLVYSNNQTSVPVAEEGVVTARETAVVVVEDGAPGLLELTVTVASVVTVHMDTPPECRYEHANRLCHTITAEPCALQNSGSPQVTPFHATNFVK